MHRQTDRHGSSEGSPLTTRVPGGSRDAGDTGHRRLSGKQRTSVSGDHTGMKCWGLLEDSVMGGVLGLEISQDRGCGPGFSRDTEPTGYTETCRRGLSQEWVHTVTGLGRPTVCRLRAGDPGGWCVTRASLKV